MNMNETADLSNTPDEVMLEDLLGALGIDDADTLLDANAPVVEAPKGEELSSDDLDLEAALAELADLPDLPPEDQPEALKAEEEAPLSEEEALEAALGRLLEDDGTHEPSAAAPAEEPPAAVSDEEKPKKAARAPSNRVTYVGHKPSDVLVARLGDKANEMLILEVGDIELPPEELEAKQKELLSILNMRPGTGNGGSTQKKVAEKIVMLFSWLKNGGTLNEVMKRTFTVLARDGYITSGDKGNLHAELLAKPYSLGTCRAQAGQMTSMLPMLKIVTQEARGKYVLKEDSVIFMKAKADLGL